LLEITSGTTTILIETNAEMIPAVPTAQGSIAIGPFHLVSQAVVVLHLFHRAEASPAPEIDHRLGTEPVEVAELVEKKSTYSSIRIW